MTRITLAIAAGLAIVFAATAALAYRDYTQINSNSGASLWSGENNNAGHEMQALRGFAMSQHSGSNKSYWTCRPEFNVVPTRYRCVHSPLPTSGARMVMLSNCTTNDGHPEPNRYDQRCTLTIGTSATEGYVYGFFLMKDGGSNNNHDLYQADGSNNPRWSRMLGTVFTNANIYRVW